MEFQDTERAKELLKNKEEMDKCKEDPRYFYNTYFNPGANMSEEEWSKYMDEVKRMRGKVIGKRRGTYGNPLTEGKLKPWVGKDLYFDDEAIDSVEDDRLTAPIKAYIKKAIKTGKIFPHVKK